MSGVAGGNRKLTLDGTDFLIAADANFSEMGGGIEPDRIATSGSSIKKLTKRVETVESVVVVADVTEAELLKALNARIDDYPMSYMVANGEVLTAVGNIVFETRETDENRATLKLQAKNGWITFNG